MKQLVEDFKQLNLVSVVAGVLVGAGILLWMFVSKSLIIVVALGAFGPGLLREFGWIDDHDDYQRHTARRAGYHAYLFTGILISVFASVLAVENQGIDAAELVNFLLLASWMAWMFSSLLSFWGARRTTSRVLMLFGGFWALFVLAHFINPDVRPGTPLWESVLGFLFGIALIALFFVPAWAAYRWPRITGWILLAGAVALLVLLSGGNSLPLMTRLMTNTLLIVPLVVCGVALILEARNDQPDQDNVTGEVAKSI